MNKGYIIFSGTLTTLRCAFAVIPVRVQLAYPYTRASAEIFPGGGGSGKKTEK